MYAIKRELDLNNRERSLMQGCAGFKRVVYNMGLDLVLASWNFEGVKAGDFKRIDAIKKTLTRCTMKRPDYAWMSQYPSTVYQSALQDLKAAFNRWRKGLAQMPVKKTKKKGDSFTVYKTSGTYPASGAMMIPFTNRAVVGRDTTSQKWGSACPISHPLTRITIPGLGTFRLKEPLPFVCTSQIFTISRKADRWFVSFTVDAEKVPPMIHPHEKVGIDLGVKCFATLSDSTKYDSPKPYKQAKTKLAKLQWRNRNKQLGHRKACIKASNNAKDFYTRSAQLHAHVSNVRTDFLHKFTTEVSQLYARIRIEDLNVSGMIANHKLAAAISDVGLFETRRMLIYKQRHYGTQVELVDRWFPSSKMCCRCHHIQPMKLSDRVFRCQNPACGHIQDRDENAAINLENTPNDQVRLAIAGIDACGLEGADTPSRSRKGTDLLCLAKSS